MQLLRETSISSTDIHASLFCVQRKCRNTQMYTQNERTAYKGIYNTPKPKFLPLYVFLGNSQFKYCLSEEHLLYTCALIGNKSEESVMKDESHPHELFYFSRSNNNKSVSIQAVIIRIHRRIFYVIGLLLI